MSISIGRIGYFFLVIGFFFLLLFFASDQSQHPKFGLFFGGLLLSVLGGFLAWHFRERPEASERFRMLKRMSEKSKKKK